MIRVLIAEPHTILRNGIKLLLDAQSDIEVVGEASNGVDALELARRLKPNIALLAIAMPRMDGITTTRMLRDAVSKTKVVILSMFETQQYVRQALNAGAHGYVIKSSDKSDLLAAIRNAAQGNIFLCPKINPKLIRDYLTGKPQDPLKTTYDTLTHREKEVFALLVQGNSTSQISDILCISVKAVEKHRGAIIRKLGTCNPIDMVKLAIHIGIIDLENWQLNNP